MTTPGGGSGGGAGNGPGGGGGSGPPRDPNQPIPKASAEPPLRIEIPVGPALASPADSTDTVLRLGRRMVRVDAHNANTFGATWSSELTGRALCQLL